jgi:hypothetical protein
MPEPTAVEHSRAFKYSNRTNTLAYFASSSETKQKKDLPVLLTGLLPRGGRRLQHSKVPRDHLGRSLRGTLRRKPDSLSSDQPTHGPHLH